MPISLLVSGIIYAIGGFFTGGILVSAQELQDERAIQLIQQFTSDWMMLCLATSLGFAFTKDYLDYFRTDAFSRRTAFYRKLPLTNREIVVARHVILLITVVPMSVCFHIPAYLIIRLGSLATGIEYLGAAVSWLGISLLAGAGYIYLELGFSGRKYLVYTMLALGIALVLLTGLGFMGIFLVGGSFQLVRNYHAWPPVLSVLAGAAGMWFVAKKTVRRLNVRDLL
jgi:hypothetical protein